MPPPGHVRYSRVFVLSNSFCTQKCKHFNSIRLMEKQNPPNSNEKSTKLWNTGSSSRHQRALWSKQALCRLHKRNDISVKSFREQPSSPNKTWRTSIKCHQRKWNTCPVEFIGSVVCARCTPARFLFYRPVLPLAQCFILCTKEYILSFLF